MKTYNMQIIPFLILALTFLGSCSDDDFGKGNPLDGSGNAAEYLEITLDPNTEFQTIHGFGASDAWSTQFVGKNYPLAKRNQIADWLFSEEVDADGNPLGIGLDIWRFNIGAGSMEQGGSSNISDEWRRAESFLTSTGYDWTAQEGQRWFVEAAKQRGVNTFIGFSNSPPVTMTKNGLANTNSPGASTANLDPANYEDFADFLATVLDNYKTQFGVEFEYISPFNEPQYDWVDGQEGSPWQNSEIAAITRLLDEKLEEKNLNTEIQIAEAAQLNYLYENNNLPARGNQIDDFFNPSSSNYLGDLSHIDQMISGHSYFTTFDTSYLIDVRSRLDEKIDAINSDLEYWMTEYTIIEDNIEINGVGRDLGIDPALYVARIIHADLTVANASSWQWWLAVSPYDYKDGLVYIDDNKNDGQIYDSKLLWGLGNYSKFIKPGYKRIGIERSDNKGIDQSINGVLVSAFQSNVDSKKVVVIVNQRSIEIPVKLSLEGGGGFNSKLYQTSGLANDNLSFKGDKTQADVLAIPARSIVTVVVE